MQPTTHDDRHSLYGTCWKYRTTANVVDSLSQLTNGKNNILFKSGLVLEEIFRCRCR